MLHEGDVIAQFGEALRHVVGLVESCGCTADDVVATHIFAVGVPEGDAFARLAEQHRRMFTGQNRSTASLLSVPG